jgi:hypothetical protein
MPLRRAEAQERLAHRCEDRTGIAPELGAEVLRAVEHAGALQELDAAVDLVHVVAAPERVERELRRHRGACRGGHRHRVACGRDAFVERAVVADALARRTGRIVWLARAAPRHGGGEDAMGAAAGGLHEEVTHRREQPLGRPDDQRRDVVGLDAEVLAVGLQSPDRAGDDADEVARHRVKG